MSARLTLIDNWPELAHTVNYSAKALAQRCGVSSRTLERYFRKSLTTTPKTWLAEQRQKRAVELLCRGFSVKEAAACLGYKYPTNLTRKLRKTGLSPSTLAFQASEKQ